MVLECEVVSFDCRLMIRQTYRVEEISNVNIFSDFQNKKELLEKYDLTFMTIDNSMIENIEL